MKPSLINSGRKRSSKQSYDPGVEKKAILVRMGFKIKVVKAVAMIAIAIISASCREWRASAEIPRMAFSVNHGRSRRGRRVGTAAGGDGIRMRQIRQNHIRRHMEMRYGKKFDQMRAPAEESPRYGVDIDSEKAEGLHGAERKLYSTFPDGAVKYPMRNELYRRPLPPQKLSSVQAEQERVEKPVIVARTPFFAFLVRNPVWVISSTEVMAGHPRLTSDGDMETRVHLQMFPDHPEKEVYISFDLGKTYNVEGLRVYPAWTSGPKDVRFSFSGRPGGPWITATEFTVEGEDGGSYIQTRWQGKEEQGYRNLDLMTEVNFREELGYVPAARFFRLFVLSAYSGAYDDDTRLPKEQTQAVIKEIQFYGALLLLGMTDADTRICSYGMEYDEVQKACILT